MKEFLSGLVIFLLFCSIASVPFMSVLRDGTDCSKETYQKLAEIQKQYPQLQPFIDEALEDDMLTWREWDHLQGKANRIEKQNLIRK